MKKNILLVGGSYGIGHAIAAALHENHHVYVASRTAEGLSGLQVTHLPFDAMTDELDVSLLPAQLDGFVYCPGSINLRPFKGSKIEQFQTDFEINFLHMVRILQRILPQLTAAEQSSVVLFSTVAVTTGMPFHSSIAAAKGAVEGFARSIAAEYAPKIRVNVVAPSLTDTPLAEKFLNTETKQEKSAERHPLKRYGQPQDIAQAAVFLLSDASSWMTGQVMAVDGGMSALSVST